MISSETDLPVDFDPKTGRGIRWSVPLGTRAYSTPIVANGHVIIGGNNDAPRDPRHQGDRGVLFCFREDDGELLWQLVVPKLQGDPYLDQPHYGICSPATVEGDRVYIVTNRAEVLCLDLRGQANGNDGPFRDEGGHMSVEGQPALEVTAIDADIIWLFDMWSELKMHPHDSAHSSILLDGDLLYLNTGNGTDNTHRHIRGPDAPSLIVLNKRTGRLVARDNERIGPRIFHSTWSSPALGVVNGQKLIFFCGGDGVCYAFKALDRQAAGNEIKDLELVWKFDCDPTAPKEDVHSFIGNRRESPSNIKSMPVLYKNRLYVTCGGDMWWGKDKSWLKCIDATLQGDITRTGQLWSVPLKQHVCTTPSIVDGLVFVGDCVQRERGGNVYCVDADTGELLWSDPTEGSIWASPMAADGKVYVPTRRGELRIYAPARTRQLINEVLFDEPIGATVTPANGRLYVATLSRLFAIEKAD